TNNFLNVYTLVQMGTDASSFAIMGVGATIVIIAGGIDLSVGAIYALAGVGMAMVLRAVGPMGPVATVFVALATCLSIALLCGLANGFMVIGLGVHPFIVARYHVGASWRRVRGEPCGEHSGTRRADERRQGTPGSARRPVSRSSARDAHRGGDRTGVSEPDRERTLCIRDRWQSGSEPLLRTSGGPHQAGCVRDLRPERRNRGVPRRVVLWICNVVGRERLRAVRDSGCGGRRCESHRREGQRDQRDAGGNSHRDDPAGDSYIASGPELRVDHHWQRTDPRRR